MKLINPEEFSYLSKGEKNEAECYLFKYRLEAHCIALIIGLIETVSHLFIHGTFFSYCIGIISLFIEGSAWWCRYKGCQINMLHRKINRLALLFKAFGSSVESLFDADLYIQISENTKKKAKKLREEYFSPLFSEKEFNFNFTVDALCKAIKSDGYNLSFSKSESNESGTAWLNKILELPDFYNKTIEKKPDFNFSGEVLDFKKITEGYRNQEFSTLDDDAQYNIRRFNRSILEDIYSDKSPRMNRYFYPSSTDGINLFYDNFYESAWWSKYLFQKSADHALKVVVGCSMLLLILLFILGPTEIWWQAPKIMLIILLFIIADELSFLLDWKTAHSYCEKVVNQLERIKISDQDIKAEHMIAIFADYSAITTAVPPIPDEIYRKHKDYLNDLWAKKKGDAK